MWGNFIYHKQFFFVKEIERVFLNHYIPASERIEFKNF